MKHLPRQPSRAGRPSFTLIEMLVAIAVLAVILIFLAQAVSLVSRTWQRGVAQVDNFSKTRVILSLVERDLQAIVLRPDLAAFTDAAGQSSFAFYSQVPGSDGSRRLSLVGYSLTNAASDPALLRLDYGLNYSNRVLTIGQTNSLRDLSLAQSQNLAEGILRFEWQFLAADGSLQPAYRFDPAQPLALSNTRSVVLSLLVVDETAFRLAKSRQILPDLLQKFSGPPAAGQTYAARWNEEMQNPGFASGLPQPVTEGIRVFERRFLVR